MPLPCTASGEKNHRATSTHKGSTESAVQGEFVPRLFIEKQLTLIQRNVKINPVVMTLFKTKAYSGNSSYQN